MKDGKDSRRRFLGQAVKVLFGGFALQSLKVEAPSSGRRPRHISWKKAMHFAKTRRPAG